MEQSKSEHFDKTKHNAFAAAQIDLTVDMQIPIEVSPNQEVKKYKCSCCGRSWNAMSRHFSKTFSPLYKANGGCLPICNDCRDAYYYKLVKLYSGNEEHAIRHFCQQFDIIFDLEALAASVSTPQRNRLAHYLARRNLGQTKRAGITYTDGLKNDYFNHRDDYGKVQSKQDAVDKERNVSASAIDRWGVGYTEIDYKNLDEHYRMLKKNNPNADSNQEIFIKDLCSINMLKVRALQNGDSKEYASLVEQYAKTFKQAGLKTIEEKDSSNDEVFGVTLATISQFTPEEFYEDKQLFSDNDDIGEYFDRHILRPMRNLQFGEDTRDTEYYVPDGDIDE